MLDERPRRRTRQSKGVRVRCVAPFFQGRPCFRSRTEGEYKAPLHSDVVLYSYLFHFRSLILSHNAAPITERETRSAVFARFGRHLFAMVRELVRVEMESVKVRLAR